MNDPAVDDFDISSTDMSADQVRESLQVDDVQVSSSDATTSDDASGEAAAVSSPTAAAPTEHARTREGKAKSIQQEIDRDVARRETAKREADAEEARLSRLRASSQTDVASSAAARPSNGSDAGRTGDDDPEPTLESAGNDENKFLRDYQRWEMREAAREVLAKNETKRQQQESAQREQTRVESAFAQFDKNLDAAVGATGTEQRKTFVAQVNPVTSKLVPYTPGQPVTGYTAIADSVIASSIPDQILLHFTANPDEFARIGALPPNAALYEVGKLEGSLSRVAAAPSGPALPFVGSAAKPPTKPLGGSPRVSADSDDDDLDDMSADAFDRWNRRQNVKDTRRAAR